MHMYLPFEVSRNIIVGPDGSTEVLAPKEVQALYVIGVIVPLGYAYTANVESSELSHSRWETIQEWTTPKK